MIYSRPCSYIFVLGLNAPRLPKYQPSLRAISNIAVINVRYLPSIFWLTDIGFAIQRLTQNLPVDQLLPTDDVVAGPSRHIGDIYFTTLPLRLILDITKVDPIFADMTIWIYRKARIFMPRCISDVA